MFWTVAEMKTLQHARRTRLSMATNCEIFSNHTRDEIVEGLDALTRFQDPREAAAWTNRVLNRQMNGRPMVNGRLDPFVRLSPVTKEPMW